ncbi:hypothetical protein D3C76_1554890 [compost metagenome]
MRDLPQGRYVHLSSDEAVLALRPSRDPRPALEEASQPLSRWTYRDARRVSFAFDGNLPLSFSVRSASACQVTVSGKTYAGRAGNGLWNFELPMGRVADGQLVCN